MKRSKQKKQGILILCLLMLVCSMTACKKTEGKDSKTVICLEETEGTVKVKDDQDESISVESELNLYDGTPTPEPTATPVPTATPTPMPMPTPLPMKAEEDEFVDGDWEYRILEDNTVELIYTYLDKESKSVTFPETVAGYPVSAIRKGIFYGESKIENVIVPESISEIDAGVFQPTAWYKNQTEPVMIGNHYIFCGDETEVVVPEGVTSVDFYASNVESVTLPSSMTVVNENAFGECKNLKKVTLSENTTSIEAYAFKESSLEEISLENVTEVGPQAFWNTKWLSQKTEPVIIGSHYIYAGDEYDVVVPDGIKTVDFYHTVIFTVTLPESVTVIPKEAFECCYSLYSISLPESLTCIEEGAFNNCGLMELKLPKNVIEVGKGAFEDCNFLTTVEIPESLKELSETMFKYNVALESVVLPEGLIGIGEDTFKLCMALESITLPNSIQYIYDGAFSGCGKLTVRVPEGSIAEEYIKKHRVLYETYVSETVAPEITAPVESEKQETVRSEEMK